MRFRTGEFAWYILIALIYDESELYYTMQEHQTIPTNASFKRIWHNFN